jgi:hypothetical protein
MILYKSVPPNRNDKHKIKTLNIQIEELPERPIYVFRTMRERVKFIKTVESFARKSIEYKEYIQFLKRNMDMNRCAVLKHLSLDNRRRYSIEIHHEPFTLFDIVDIVLTKRLTLDEEINPFLLAEEVMNLHYEEKIGLIPLTVTMHELVGNGKIFIPLQLIYHKYHKFYEEYEDYIAPQLKEKIQVKIDLSLKYKEIASNILEPEFIYINIEGFDFPEIPDKWKDALKNEVS